MTKQSCRCYACKDCGNCWRILLQDCIWNAPNIYTLEMLSHLNDRKHMIDYFGPNKQEVSSSRTNRLRAKLQTQRIKHTVQPAYLKKKEDKIPWAALLHIRSMVAFESPWKISKLSGPESDNTKWSHNWGDAFSYNSLVISEQKISIAQRRKSLPKDPQI